MTFMCRVSSLSLLVALAACAPAAQSDGPAPDGNGVAMTGEPSERTDATSPPVGHAHADWAGHWIGVEGLFVKITPTTAGRYDLEMQSDLDGGAAVVEGRDSDGGIAFDRNGETLLLRRATGEETGLKYLADEQNCLMVKEGEGFCRD